MKTISRSFRVTILTFVLSLPTVLFGQFAEEIECQFSPSFVDGKLVWMARTDDGKVFCTVYSVPEMEQFARDRSKWTVLKSPDVSLSSFREIAALIESDEFRKAAEVTPQGGMDGVTWTFRRTAGRRAVEIRIWTPEARPELASSVLTIALGKKVASAAGIEGLLE